jgi:hypothetical protein
MPKEDRRLTRQAVATLAVLILGLALSSGAGAQRAPADD